MTRFFIAALIAGCAADRNANTQACETDADCLATAMCYRNFCIARDAGQCVPCYTGEPATSAGVGVCQTGCEGVDENGDDACLGQSTPTEEACNDLDDDCDGSTDEDFPRNTLDACGGCNTACEAGEQCCESRTMGVFECANTLISADHCGACGEACDGGEVCCGMAGCVDIMTDGMHCGACNNPCAAGRECCDGTCVDPRSSNEHCGGCPGMQCDGTPESTCCPAAAMPTEIGCRNVTECVTCDPMCGVGETCCAGACFDLRTDDLNCGGCGAACAPGERCCGSTCVSIETACGDCDTPCDDAQQCCADACIADRDHDNCLGCGVGCMPAQECCATGCTDPMIDELNCGMCGEACGMSEVCSLGHCCPGGAEWCGDEARCQNTQSANNEHCGRCGERCTGFETCNRGLFGNQPWGCRAL